MEPRPAPEASAYDPEWRHSPGIQYGIGIGTGIALGNVPFAPIAMDFGIATGMVGHGSKYANVGRALGEMAVGITLLMGGVTGELVGGLLDVTTIGAFLGVPVGVVSFGLVVSGLADLGAGAAELSAAMSQEDGSGATAGGTPPQQPARTAGPIRNSHLANKAHPKTGVPFDEAGCPDFSAYRHPDVPDVRIELSGKRSTDFARANAAAGLKETPAGYTWHHNQDKGLMQLVETEIHKHTGHTGGLGTR